MSRIIFSYHSLEKIKILKEHGFNITKKDILSVIRNPDKILMGYKGRKISQKIINSELLLRVVFLKGDNIIKVITIYPGRRDRYEN